MKRISMILAVAVILLAASCSFADYPEKNLSGFIGWGAGGGTDGVSRAITPLAEPYLGKTVVLQNRPGAAGVIAATYVASQPADGYSLLYSAENTATYRVTDLSPLSFNDFEPIIILVEGTVVVCVNPETPYKTMQDLVDAAKAGKKINMGNSGTGGLPYVAAAMMKTIHDVDFNFIQFDGDGPGATAVMGGHIDVMSFSLAPSVENIRGGKLRALAVLRTERVPQLPDVPAITEIYPEYAKYLPWGPIYGVFVKKGTPENIVGKLTEAFLKGASEPRFDEFVKNSGGIKINLTGDAAKDYIRRYESTASWLIYDAGGAKKSPEEFGIAKPE